jgi:hypothetical protein
MEMKNLFLASFLALVFSSAALAAPQIKGLAAQGPDPEFAAKLSLFGQFVGDWECDFTAIQPDGSRETRSCEWHWGWILQGRAIQDVCIIHSGAELDSPLLKYGTTIRVYDPRLDAWHIVFFDPIQGDWSPFTARKVGDEIVLESGHDDGRISELVFSDIEKNSFHWRAQITIDNGKSWHVVLEMNARRAPSSE